MKYYLAPMDNITDYIYRQIVWRHFPYWDKMYAPFIQPNEKPTIVPKENRDICPENNLDLPVVPQILTCDPEGFIRVGKILEDYGYREINLNLGCPAKAIVSKGKGSAMLADTHKLNQFLQHIFNHEWKAKITIKTRLGLTDNSDFDEVLDVFSKYPIHELIIHPRFRTDYYGGSPRLNEYGKVFNHFYGSSKSKFYICYNGNIFSKNDALNIVRDYPLTDNIMCGRGAIANPALIRELKGGLPMKEDEFKAFHDDVYHSYQCINLSERHFLHKMMEMWTYWISNVNCNEEVFKKLRFASDITNYNACLNELYSDFSIKHVQ